MSEKVSSEMKLACETLNNFKKVLIFDNIFV